MATDPTKTITIRARASREIDRRFAMLRREVRKAVFVGKLITNQVTPRQYEFLRDPQKIEAFNQWLQNEINLTVLGIRSGEIQPKNFWLNAYVGSAYERGAKKARKLAERNIKYNLIEIPEYSPLLNHKHIERAELIYQRVYNGMKGITDTMRHQIDDVLSRGIINGDNPKTVAKALTERVDKIGITRAKLIARTEIVESHNQASIKEAEILEDETGVEIKVKWITSLDGRERDSHRARHKKTYTREKALELIGEPNCRCSVSAYINPDDL